MQNIKSVSSYLLTDNEMGEVVQASGEAFDKDSYSRMKHGVVSDAYFFANRLTETLYQENSDLIDGESAFSFVVAYESLPHAATIITEFLLESINKRRLEFGKKPASLTRIYTKDYMTPYSSKSLAERKRILESQTFNIKSKDIHDRQLVIVDDIRITGSQELWFYKALAPHTSDTISAAYIASFSEGISHPEIEGSLDKAYIKTLYDLLPYIKDRNVAVTHKLLRDLLLLPHNELLYFLTFLPNSMIFLLQKGIRGMLQSTLRPYKENCKTIILKDTNKIPAILRCS